MASRARGMLTRARSDALSTAVMIVIGASILFGGGLVLTHRHLETHQQTGNSRYEDLTTNGARDSSNLPLEAVLHAPVPITPQTLFVVMAAYREKQCVKTLASAYDNSAFPDSL